MAIGKRDDDGAKHPPTRHVGGRFDGHLCDLIQSQFNFHKLFSLLKIATTCRDFLLHTGTTGQTLLR